ncbi:hypothetical protein B0H17DRAFT_1124905 [Mycena rosella]|uniref:Uncharacterized protein n=1 Tax=Mycena rosella TaxID=1033263 RepID=A0AAD7GYQ7_MYCRO|nr:hypothetical protein B0H17DRAFT_1124905 [Mycena rosella]
MVQKEICGIKKARAGRGSEPTAPLPDLPVLRQPRNSTETFKINTLRGDKRLSSTELMYLLNTHTWTKLESGLILIIAKSVVEERNFAWASIGSSASRYGYIVVTESSRLESQRLVPAHEGHWFAGWSDQQGEVKGAKSRSVVL